MSHRFVRVSKVLAASLAVCLGILVIFEIGLRFIAGFPSGKFEFAILTGRGLYPPNRTMVMDYGFAPYVVETNSLGFRGRELPREKAHGCIRIAALGDSITDGFFVDNEDTYPELLWNELAGQGLNIDVVNAAAGSGSIAKELAVFRDAVLPLGPDIAIVVFYANDVDDLSGRTRQELLEHQLDRRDVRGGFFRWLVARTAVGEAVGRAILAVAGRDAMRLRAQHGRRYGDERYEIPGRRHHEKNIEIYAHEYWRTDWRVLRDEISSETLRLVDNYLFVLDELTSRCHAEGVDLVFVYFPAYAQTYDVDSSLRINDLLRGGCAKLGVPFLDLTEAFRAAADGAPLYLAPADFHPSPAGNRLMASEIARFLTTRGVIARARSDRP